MPKLLVIKLKIGAPKVFLSTHSAYRIMTATTTEDRKEATHISIWKRSRVSVQEGECREEGKQFGQKLVSFSMHSKLWSE